MKLSIITVNLNNAEGLRTTALSIVGQSCHDFEWIVIDGGSTDGSTEVLSDFKDRITFMVSEKDSGIYNAMNKGVRVANGEYLLFLNSGDYLADKDIIEQVLFRGFDADIVYGDQILVKGGKAVGERKYDDSLSFYSLKRFSLPHQASFLRRHLLIENPYDESYKIVADKNFYLQMALAGKSFRHIPLFISCFDISGVSNANIEDLMREEERMMKETVPQCIQNDYANGRMGALITLRRRHKLFGKFITFLIISMEKIDLFLK